MKTMRITLYKIFLLISSIIVFILWSISIHQLCITKIQNRKRLWSVILLCLFSTCCVILNSLVYLSSLYPNFNWQGVYFNTIWNILMLSNFIEALTLLIGFHIGRIVVVNMIHKLYLLTNTKPP
eukprot:35628_1